MALDQLIENQVRNAEAVEQPVVADGAIHEIQAAEQAKLREHLQIGNESNSMNIWNAVIAGLLVGIPAYMGAGFLIDHLPFALSAGTHNMVRFWAMFGVRPIINKFTTLLNRNVITPASTKLQSIAENKFETPLKEQISRQVANVKNSVAVNSLRSAIQTPQLVPTT